MPTHDETTEPQAIDSVGLVGALEDVYVGTRVRS
jgi:hypothetical protein